MKLRSLLKLRDVIYFFNPCATIFREKIKCNINIAFFARNLQINIKWVKEITISGILFFGPSKIAALLVTSYSCRLCGFDARVAVPWDSGRPSDTLSHGKGRARQARLEFRRSARSPVLGSPSIGIHSSGWSERRGSILPRPTAAAASTGFCMPLRFPILLSLSLSLSLSLHFRPSPWRPAKYHPLTTLIFHG